MDDYIVTLKNHFGFDTFRDKQLEVIDAVLKDGRDVCAILFTGAGKSLCFQFPPVHTKKVALIVSPLISLMNDQRIKLENIGISSACLNSTIAGKNKIQNDVLKNRYRLVYCTPEYLSKNEEFLRKLEDTGNLLTICIDESHCISSWGSDFRPTYKKLSVLKDWFPNVPVTAFTATATTRVQKDIIDTLQLKNPKVVKTTFDRPNLLIKVLQKGSMPLIDILPLVEDGEPTIVYCQTRKQTETITKVLKNRGIQCNTYHAGMNSLDRELVHESFVKDEITCVVATIAFGMGIDKVIRRVIHYGMPKDMESYYQEIGRAGRDGKRSDCYLFYSNNDVGSNNYFINQIKNPTYRLHKMRMTNVMKKYVYTRDCRRIHILQYFGEKYKKDNCGSCDNCLNNKTVIKKDFTKEALFMLTTIYDTGSTYGIGKIISILRGSNSKDIPYEYKKLSVFGKGKYRSAEWWKVFSKMLMNIDYIIEKPVPGGRGFVLGRTLKAKKWLKLVATGLNLKDDIDDHRLLLALPPELSKTSLMNDDLKPFDEESGGTKSLGSTGSGVSKGSSKGKTHEKTYQMFQNDNMSVTEIAKVRGYKKITIEDHLVKNFEMGKELDLERLGFSDKIFTKIQKKIGELGNPDRLRDIKRGLPGITYLQIRLAQVKMNSKDSDDDGSGKSDECDEADESDEVIVKPKKKKKFTGIKLDFDNIEDSYDSFDSLDPADDLDFGLSSESGDNTELLIDSDDHIKGLEDMVKTSKKDSKKAKNNFGKIANINL